MTSTLNPERSTRFKIAVGEILKTKSLTFPRQIFFQMSGRLYIFFDGSLQGYGACIYVQSVNHVNILTSSAKIMGKSALTAPQSEISAAVLAVRMEIKVKQELYNINLQPSVFIGDSEIILRMIAKNDPVDLPIFYGTRIMEIVALSDADSWFWCPGPLNPADLLTRTGSTLEHINSRFWLNGSFLTDQETSWPIKSCKSLLSNQPIIASINRAVMIPDSPFCNYVVEMLTACNSFIKVVKSLTLLMKIWILPRLHEADRHTGNNVSKYVSSTIVSCFKPSADTFLA